ncbi:NAD(P)-binding domain protein [Acididesulfobacillus acetoxydans]|uniref:Dinucleotide-utilizing enzyme possibly involved in molybdopterin or thiamin biosynthesis n=1 Tax=Acididesulfobacillus acetoxydans TaxID=1561005 RepID=A0A8S0XWK1_9FIRM|nr:HesA/MoeB/ThiF family protein [Acididesulfobacillus acetoxydans]CAA7601087.1 NAD(P)-binding domain protein [Acididesulfobacillus acetoxydans]CEJ06961.1 Dinucleotide-utilizing enzyme possibly involved in molybdopterin or thiamin biosynthesis [Acididesulfobacillus acetoxydans]
MEPKKFADRYLRNQKTISQDEQAKLAKATVVIAGCGGLGGYISEEMARVGVGHLVLIDGDRIDVTNLNRQILAAEDNIGEWKAEAGRERIRRINSGTKVDAACAWFREEDSAQLLAGADLVCDALDSLSARLALERSCHTLGIPLLYAAIGGWFGILGLSFPGEYCVARLLKGGDKGIETLWGNPAFTPAVVASLAVAEGVKVLTGKSPALRGSWLQIDLLAMEFELFRLSGETL